MNFYFKTPVMELHGEQNVITPIKAQMKSTLEEQFRDLQRAVWRMKEDILELPYRGALADPEKYR